MQKLDISVIILTKNENLHLQRCIENLYFVKRIIVVDSGSIDNTKQIAIDTNCDFYFNEWINYAIQFNWALKNCNIQTKYTMRMDADEYLTKDSISELLNLFNSNIDYDGVILKRINKFLGKEINHGGLPVKLLRIWKTNHAYCENKWMDEHINFYNKNYSTVELGNFLVDHNLNNNKWWADKINGYGLREAIDYFVASGKLNIDNSNAVDYDKKSEASLKKYLKNKVFYKVPLFIRPFLFFIYTYIFKFGFLDGRVGFVFHLRQTLWYRLLVDFFIYEVEKKSKESGKSVKEVIESEYGMKL